MAEGSVSFLLMKLSELLQGEEQLLRGVNEDAEYIKDELEFTKAFLRVAEAMAESDPRLKVWVKKVRDVAYDMEDALDEFRLRLVRDHDRQWQGNYAYFQKLFFTVKTLGARHRIASTLRSIKLRVQGLAEQQKRYSDQYSNEMRQGVLSTNPRRQMRRGLTLKLESDLVGIEQHKTKLIKQLDGDRTERYVVSVVGMGGLGKSTLVRIVYDDPEIKNHFKFRAWITVSPSYIIEDLLKNVIQQLYGVLFRPEPQGLDNMDNQRLRGEIDHLLRQRRYLIVLDDVWDTNLWNDFNEVLPNNKSSSRVLLTTRDESIAFHSCEGSHDNIYHLTPLSQEDSRLLFCKKLFKTNTYPSNLREVAERFLRGCEGLPLAITALTGVLSTKDTSRVDEWEMVYDSLGDALEDDDMLEGLKTILSRSYDELPYYLKSCLLYLSIFPQGNPIGRARIIRMWVAEGFVKEREGMTPEDVADSYLNELIKRSLVKVVVTTDDGRIKTCRIHDILREIMISKSKEQVFAAIVKDQSMRWPEKVRRVSIHNATASILQRQKTPRSRLRSLLMFWTTDSDSSPESPALKLSFHHLRFLNVLHLDGAPLMEFPHHIVHLFLLKYLSLRNTKVASIPSSIEKLQNLETLDMKHAQVTELPIQILRLQKLRHLLVYKYKYESDAQIHTKYGFKSPKQIGKLQSIQKLCFLEADHELLVELGKLSQLRRLGIVKLRRQNGKVLCSSIGKLMNLRALSLTSAEEDEIINMDYLSSPPRFLQRLYLTGRLKRFPEWVSSLHSLTKVVMKWSLLNQDPLQPLQELPHLVHLAFVQVYNGQELCFRKNGFQKLKFLGLNRLDKLQAIVLEEGAVHILEKLVVHSCCCLHKVPQGIEHLTELRVLEFFDMPEELVTSLRNTRDGDYKKIEHVPEIYFIGKNDRYLVKHDFKT